MSKDLVTMTIEIDREVYGTLPVPTLQYYKFVGWFTEASFGSLSPSLSKKSKRTFLTSCLQNCKINICSILLQF